MKKRGYFIGGSAIAAGMLSIILMCFSFLRRSTTTAAGSRMTYYNSFEVINFNGVWSIKAVSILQIILIVFAVSTIVIGVLKVLEIALNKEQDLDESVLIALSILAFIGICLIFFAVIYCKFSNRIADTEAYKISYRVFIAPFMQVALTIAGYAVAAIMSAKNNKELLEALADEAVVETEGEVEEEVEGEVVLDSDAQVDNLSRPELDDEQVKDSEVETIEQTKEDEPNDESK